MGLNLQSMNTISRGLKIFLSNQRWWWWWWWWRRRRRRWLDDDDDDGDVQLAAVRRPPCPTQSAPRLVLAPVPTCTASRRHRVTVTAATRAASVHPARSSLPPTMPTSTSVRRRWRGNTRRRIWSVCRSRSAPAATRVGSIHLEAWSRSTVILGTDE